MHCFSCVVDSAVSHSRYLGTGHVMSYLHCLLMHAPYTLQVCEAHESNSRFTIQVYVRLNERLGLRDHLMVLTVMLTKICTNLKVFGCAEDVIQDSLTLFSVSPSGI